MRLANPLTGAYSVTVGQFVNPLPAGDVDATAGPATVTAGRLITPIPVTNGGSGYATGTVTAIAVTNGGTGYTSANPPTVTIVSSNGAGSGATAAAVVDDSTGTITGISLTGVVSIESTNGGGSGYSAASPPAVTISGGGGSGATATAVVNAAGVITQIVLNNPGLGYTSAPTVTITAPGGTGTTALAVANLPRLARTILGPDGHDLGRHRHRCGGDSADRRVTIRHAGRWRLGGRLRPRDGGRHCDQRRGHWDHDHQSRLGVRLGTQCPDRLPQSAFASRR